MFVDSKFPCLVGRMNLGRQWSAEIHGDVFKQARIEQKKHDVKLELNGVFYAIVQTHL